VAYLWSKLKPKPSSKITLVHDSCCFAGKHTICPCAVKSWADVILVGNDAFTNCDCHGSNSSIVKKWTHVVLQMIDSIVMDQQMWAARCYWRSSCHHVVLIIRVRRDWRKSSYSYEEETVCEHSILDFCYEEETVCEHYDIRFLLWRGNCVWTLWY
jgi:hypothetical protein